MIYILKLEKNKFYIGKTKNIDFRIEQHFNYRGSYWTKKYKPIKIHKIIQNHDEYDEDKYTIKYMNKYGIDNVRGGSFSRINLDESDIIVINKMLRNSTDKCFKCGSNTHFINDCNKIEENVHPIINTVITVLENADNIINYIDTTLINIKKWII